jgi:hypothetical protein
VKLEDLKVGTKYGKWEILSKCLKHNPKDPTMYECKCDCGVIKLITRYDLVHGGTTQCQRCGRKQHRRNHFLFLRSIKLQEKE